jgi:hypothetical protein
VTDQLTLLDAAANEWGVCQYGHPQNVGRCMRPATHRARARKAGGDTEVDVGLECCRDHADYYASAWAPLHLQVGASRGGRWDEAAWIDVLAWEETEGGRL